MSGTVQAGSRSPGTDLSGRRSLASALFLAPSLPDTARLDDLFEVFRDNRETDVCVIVNAQGAPVGVVPERALRPFCYHRYGRDLLLNEQLRRGPLDFSTRWPVVDVQASIPDALQSAVQGGAASGVIVATSGRYAGVLTPAALLSLAAELRQDDALDRNPLSRLPGNRAVDERIAELCRAVPKSGAFLIYFDFDNFKPFNDSKGFRQGDRAIVLFAEALRRHLPDQHGRDLLAHLGGDDFMAILSSLDEPALRGALSALLEDFRQSAEAFFSAAERAAGGLRGRDRYGELRFFPLLRCSAMVLEIPPGGHAELARSLDTLVPDLKSAAKASAAGSVWHRLADGRGA